jgi:endonuclease-3 related protein
LKKNNYKTLPEIYDLLFRNYGAQYWWPAESPFDVMVGDILTQSAAWPAVELAELIYPSGYHHARLSSSMPL